MAHKTLAGGTAYEITGGKTLVGGTAYSIAGGKTLVGGTAYDIPFTSNRIGDLPVGSSVFFNMGSGSTEFLVVNQGIPGNSSLYDASCDGTWLLTKDVHTKASHWDNDSYPSYGSSYVHEFLRDQVLPTIDESISGQILTAQIPCYEEYPSSCVYTLSTKLFLLSCTELGFSYDDTPYFYADEGACLEYFSNTTAVDSKRIAYFEGETSTWWTRTIDLYSGYSNRVCYVRLTGACYYAAGSYSGTVGTRVALIMSSDALVDPDTMEVLG